MDTAQWPQEKVVKPIEEIVTNTCPKASCFREEGQASERTSHLLSKVLIRKTCKRYWTEGVSLRNIPDGGVCHKLLHKTTKTLRCHDGQDLNLAFPSTQISLNLFNYRDIIKTTTRNPISSSTSASTTPSQLSALELLTGRGLNSFPRPVQDPSTLYNIKFSSSRIQTNLEFLFGWAWKLLWESPRVQEANERLFTVQARLILSKIKSMGDSTGYWTGILIKTEISSRTVSTSPERKVGGTTGRWNQIEKDLTSHISVVFVVWGPTQNILPRQVCKRIIHPTKKV
ncbi:hypothetical protein NC652_040370 [Populus alba x Populus x berolinensis]|nr:hypothetical protein NC652_040370 [Populus alba x Populus x berolinensis]